MATDYGGLMMVDSDGLGGFESVVIIVFFKIFLFINLLK